MCDYLVKKYNTFKPLVYTNWRIYVVFSYYIQSIGKKIEISVGERMIKVNLWKKYIDSVWYGRLWFYLERILSYPELVEGQAQWNPATCQRRRYFFLKKVFSKQRCWTWSKASPWTIRVKGTQNICYQPFLMLERFLLWANFILSKIQWGLVFHKFPLFTSYY